MSKSVRKVGRVLSGTFKGITKAVKKVWKSKIGRIVLIAVAAMVVGPMVGALANGASFSAAWSAGVGNLTATLSGAGSALASGEIGTALSTLGSGLAGSNVPAELAFNANLGASWMAPVAETGAAAGGAATTTTAAQTATNALKTIPEGSAPAIAKQAEMAAATAKAAPVAQQPSWFAKMMESKYAAPALISAGGQVISSVGQGIAQRDMANRQEAQRQEDLARILRNQNVSGVTMPRMFEGFAYKGV